MSAYFYAIDALVRGHTAGSQTKQRVDAWYAMPMEKLADDIAEENNQ